MIVDINHISKKYKGVTILDDITIKMSSGKIYGLKGKNGSGKTMLMRAITGLIIPSEGSIKINDELLHKDISFPRSVGALIENPAFLGNYDAFNNLKLIAMIKNEINEKDIKNAITAVGLDPNDKKKYKKFSLGMKQRLGIACAIMESPDLLILDEPTNALDEKGILLVRDLLIESKNRGAIVIVACHDSEELNLLADEIYVMSEGKIVEKIEREEKTYEV